MSQNDASMDEPLIALAGTRYRVLSETLVTAWPSDHEDRKPPMRYVAVRVERVRQ